MFLKMEAIYRQKWLDLFPSDEAMEESMIEWGHGLKGMTLGQISKAIEVVRVENKWPPSIAEFRQAGVRKDKASGDAYRIVDKSRLLDSDQRKAKRKEARQKFLNDMKAKGLTR